MADSPLPPPPPPAPGQGAADAPLPPIEGATAPAAAKKPATRKPTAAKAAPAEAAPPPASAAETPGAVRPDPYAPGPAAPANPSAPQNPSAPHNPYAALPTAPSSTLSVLALVFGIMGLIFSFFLLGLLPAIAGVILGHLGVKREPHARGMAIAGLTTGYVGIAISVLWALAILVPLVLLWFGIAAAGAWSTF
ncbi:DUF4190 domain-containing protein [Microcella sp.]|uniref:DUF4190 domain-containing protein n=1 Tax=Microcella sp. TaxID=1913979 RepID=UPI003F71EA84